MSRFALAALIALSFAFAFAASPLPATEVITLDASNYDATVPAGKEVDAIYGDTVLRNDKIVAVIGNSIAGRNANLTVKEVAGCLLDLTRRDSNNDQLSCFFPNAGRAPYRSGAPSKANQFAVNSDEKDVKQPYVTTTYVLPDGAEYIQVATTYTNKTDKEMKVALIDSMRADRSFDQGFDEALGLMWVYDRWFGQAYGVVVVTEGVKQVPPPATATPGRIFGNIYYEKDGKREVTLEPGKSFTLTRRVIPGSTAFEVRTIAERLAGVKQQYVMFRVNDADGSVRDADVLINKNGKLLSRGRTDAKGTVEMIGLPVGEYEVVIYALGRTEHKQDLTVQRGESQNLPITLDQPGYVLGKITDANGGPIPCKVQFIGIEPTKDPFFFVDGGEHQVHNCRYSDDGAFKQPIGPGKYQVIISYGPEYDAIFTQIEVARGKEVSLAGKLVRTVDTKGWISSDFHSHSSPSGDNTSSQFGRVLNLLCEHIEFAPCTEHQRIDSYTPHLKRLKVEHLMATCTGMELTGLPLPLNHQNVFPLIHKPHTQDGGGPLVHPDPRAQIERVYLWDNKSEKVVQQNHPDIVKMFFDKDGDGKMDKGLDMAPFMTVIEVHPPLGVFTGAKGEFGGKKVSDRSFRWMQTLNQGYRVPGVVNTDAHYNFHGSGWLRNWIKSPTDDPAKVNTMDIVRESNKGHVIMSNGPFLEVGAWWNNPLIDAHPSDPGDDLVAKDGKVSLRIRVQCPNWFDVNRVQVFINGRPDPKLNFTRKSHPAMFTDGAVKFDQTLDVLLKSDAHLIIATVGEGLELGAVMGPQRGKDVPVAVSNPIYVDVDGGGFKANGDDLDAPIEKK
ncbi:MAG: CehA/McbA family metallohydrolase [Phycisphaeraceae bacterium]